MKKTSRIFQVHRHALLLLPILSGCSSDPTSTTPTTTSGETARAAELGAPGGSQGARFASSSPPAIDTRATVDTPSEWASLTPEHRDEWRQAMSKAPPKNE